MSVKMVDRTLLLFEAFAGRGEPLTLSELARTLSMPVSTCFNVMRTLQARGYLYEVGGRKTFYPTPRLFEKARAIAAHDPIRALLHPHLEALRDETGETVILGKRLGDEVVYLEVIEGVHSIRYSADAGDLKPLHSSATGKALLGALPPAEREALVARLRLARVTPTTITQRTQLLRELDASVRRGWYVTRGENVADVMAIAVTLTVGADVVAVALAGPIHRVEPKQDAQARRLIAAARTMGRR